MFEPRLALASLSGTSDAEWAKRGADQAGLALLGGIAVDGPTRRAARAMVDRGRSEFLPTDPIDYIDAQLAVLDEAPVRAGMNVRAVDPHAVRAVARVCARHEAVVEINAHCRQSEMCAAGAGETLLQDVHRLREQVAAAADTGALVSVKLRTEVPGVDLVDVSREVSEAGAELLHIDAMDSEAVVGTVTDAVPEAFVIANNGVRDRPTTWEYLEHGADAVSVGRASDDEVTLERVRRALADWHARDSTRLGGPVP